MCRIVSVLQCKKRMRRLHWKWIVTMDEFIIKMNTFVEDVGSLSQNAKDASDQIGQQEEQPVNVENSVEMQGEASE